MPARHLCGRLRAGVGRPHHQVEGDQLDVVSKKLATSGTAVGQSNRSRKGGSSGRQFRWCQKPPVESGAVHGRRCAGCVAYFVASSQVDPPTLRWRTRLSERSRWHLGVSRELASRGRRGWTSQNLRPVHSHSKMWELFIAVLGRGEGAPQRRIARRDRSTVHEQKRRDNWEDTLNR